ncbi:hypothetical protein RSSM_03269 [Rhodopirellula sallentina SM41]|uniref:Uncharacterized protein n=1 Tax=Rhodopirellula sallentina SM41 TaxID=1263870 RepID=M5U1C9_9BACT|nr:hypothetical protein RSSM_03269 [Rhodopirellula sallentina SM41]
MTDPLNSNGWLRRYRPGKWLSNLCWARNMGSLCMSGGSKLPDAYGS